MQVIPVHIDKEIVPSDDLSSMIAASENLTDGDVVVVAQKVVSKQEGRLVRLTDVSPSLLSQGISSQYQKDSRVVELILSESKRIVRMSDGILIVETNSGFVCANAGIDESNVKEGYVTLLPVDSDVSASRIRDEIFEITGKNVAIIISDTFGRPFRMGQTNIAIGISGLKPILDYAGTLDSFEKTLRVSAIAVADEISSASELVMGKSLNCPAAIIRDYSFDFENCSIGSLLRDEDEDLFR